MNALVQYLDSLKAKNPAAYAASRVRHNRWQAAHGTRVALADWLVERQAPV